MLPLYRFITFAGSPFVKLFLNKRRERGKEDPVRFNERFGHASQARPTGKLIWLHAASVGESNSVLPLMEGLCARYPELHILFTTGTVTSAQLLIPRLPSCAVHQYIPVDTPFAVRRFIRHWKPDAALWVESELWPNLVLTTRASGCVMMIVNGRMSERSFRLWQQYGRMVKRILSCFCLVLPQSEDDAQRFRALGAPDVDYIGNLKFDAPPLPADAAALDTLLSSVKGRPIWVAASTHPGEESMIAQVHSLLKAAHPGLLTVIVPRHPERGEAIAAIVAEQGLNARRRAAKESLAADTDIYIADTLGELGIFYRLSGIVFMGGSLVPHGGQNPLEAARLNCAVICGTHMDNFADICRELESHHACLRASDLNQLAAQLGDLFAHPDKQKRLAEAAYAVVLEKQGIVERTLQRIEPFINPLFRKGS